MNDSATGLAAQILRCKTKKEVKISSWIMIDIATVLW